MSDVLILGGGVMGLSLAYELSHHGVSVRLIDRAAAGQEASWAGAGILPPGNRRTATHPYEALVGLSHELHPQWAQRLRDGTGVDNGYHRTGGLYVARDDAAARELREKARWWSEPQIPAEAVSPGDLPELEPAVGQGENLNRVQAAYLLPGEGQIRNPRHLKALLAACLVRGVTVEEGVAAGSIDVQAGRVRGVRTSGGVLRADKYCICAGAWSRSLLQSLGVTLSIRPIRGQMVLLSAEGGCLRRIISEGARYIVPRPDGRVLAGSTEEDAGFDKRTTANAVADLLSFAIDLAPGLRGAPFEKAWAGLRPGSPDGLPYLGPIPGLENAYAAAGHFRSGLQLAPATAVVMAQLIRGETPDVELSPFALDRR